MKKLLIAGMLLVTASFCFAYTHHIDLSGFNFWPGFKSDGMYEFSLKGDWPTKTKTWRIKMTEGKPRLVFWGAKGISPKKDIQVFDDFIKVDGKGWCYRKLRVRALSGLLKGQEVWSIPRCSHSCRSHRFKIYLQKGYSRKGQKKPKFTFSVLNIK